MPEAQRSDLAPLNLQQCASNDSTISSNEAKITLTEYCESHSALQAAIANSNRSLAQGGGLLAVAYLMMATNLFGILVLAVALAGTWLTCRGVGANETVETLQISANRSKKQLKRTMKQLDSEARTELLNDSLDEGDNRRWLATFLPGPVEVGRRVA